MILAENGFPFELVLFVVIVLISALSSIVQWMNKKFGKGQEEEERGTARQRPGYGPSGEEDAEPGQALRNFLEEMTGRRPAATTPEATRRPAARPQRPPRPARRPAEEPVTLEEEPARAAERRAPRPRPSERRVQEPRKPRPPRQRPAAKPAPRRSLEEIAILEEAGGEFAQRVKPQAREDWISQLPGTEIQRAIVLMEVLGTPRAKRPHRPGQPHP